MEQNYVDPSTLQGRLPCPVCGADPEARSWRSFVTSSYTNILSDKHSMMGTKVSPLVCSSCGYVQLFVDPRDFRGKK
jgi:hypothetical protein